MVATQLNDLVSSGQLSEFTVVQINRYITSLVNNTAEKKRYLKYLNLESNTFHFTTLCNTYFQVCDGYIRT